MIVPRQPRSRLVLVGVALTCCGLGVLTPASLAATPAAAPTRASTPAARPSPRAALLAALQGIDTVPNAAALRRAAPDNTVAELVAIATDARISGWIRLRAVSVLPMLGAPAADPLRQLADRGDLSTRLRWWAVYGWLRSSVPPAQALAQARRWLASPDWQVREAVVRGLRHVTGEPVTRLLQQHAEVERDATVRAALRHVARRR